LRDLRRKGWNLNGVETYLDKTFDKIDGKEEEVVKDEEALAEDVSICKKTKPEEFRRPKLTPMKLVTKPIDV
jgi:hypothetical protein